MRIALMLGLTGLSLAARAAEVPVSGQAVPAMAAYDAYFTKLVEECGELGAQVAVGRHGKLVFNRGYGWADKAAGDVVQPDSLFRIASVTKPLTATAVFELVDKGLLTLDDRVCDRLDLKPTADERWQRITVRQLLQHTGGWDRDKSGDPMFWAARIAKAERIPSPPRQWDIIRYMLTQPLDFEPGSKSVYSNFGFCLLGRVIEKVSGQSYEAYVQEHVLAPVGVSDMRLGQTRLTARAPREVRYYTDPGSGPSVFPPVGKQVPWQYGGWCIEDMDSHGGWLASAGDLVKFAMAFDDAAHSPLLTAGSIGEMFGPPPGSVGHDAAGKRLGRYYACGWCIVVVGERGLNTWHNGALDGTSTLLVRRFDGLDWAVLFNRRTKPGGKEDLAAIVDGPLHRLAGGVKAWP